MLRTRAPVTSQPAWPPGGGGWGVGLPLGLPLVLLGVNRRFLLFRRGGVVRTGVRTKGERPTGSWGVPEAAMESSPLDFGKAEPSPISLGPPKGRPNVGNHPHAVLCLLQLLRAEYRGVQTRSRCESFQIQVKQAKGWCSEVSWGLWLPAGGSGWRTVPAGQRGCWPFRAGTTLLGIWPE